MRLSDGAVIGLCYGFSFPAANLYAVLSIKDAVRHLRFDRGALLRMIGWSLLFAIPVAAALWAVDRLLGSFGEPIVACT